MSVEVSFLPSDEDTFERCYGFRHRSGSMERLPRGQVSSVCGQMGSNENKYNSHSQNMRHLNNELKPEFWSSPGPDHT
jgi:hypothetical protein